MHYFDILFFAVVAAVLLWRLRAVLGQRRDDEPRRPNPFGLPDAGGNKNGEDEEFVVRPTHEIAVPAAGQPRQALPPPVLAPESLAGGIELIRRQDPSFDEKRFLAGARSAFELIVQAFARGDLGALKTLLGPEVYAAFAAAIAARQEAGQRLETKIDALKDAELVRARLTGETARLTVRFVSEQTNATYDKDSQVIDGDPAKREVIEDDWTFARNVKQSDPAWLLVETKAR